MVKLADGAVLYPILCALNLYKHSRIPINTHLKDIHDSTAGMPLLANIIIHAAAAPCIMLFLAMVVHCALIIIFYIVCHLYISHIRLYSESGIGVLKNIFMLRNRMFGCHITSGPLHDTMYYYHQEQYYQKEQRFN